MKNELEAESEATASKKKKTTSKKASKQVRKSLFSSEDEDEEENWVPDGVSEDDAEWGEAELREEYFDLDLQKDPEENDFVLVRYPTGKVSKFYVAQVLEKKRLDQWKVTFLRKCIKIHDAFQFPIIEEVSVVGKSSIVMVLPKPHGVGTTKRQQNILRFVVKMNNLYMG